MTQTNHSVEKWKVQEQFLQFLLVKELGKRQKRMVARGSCEIEVAMTCGRGGSGLMLPLWEEVLWPFLDAWDSVRLRTISNQWNVPRRCGPHCELFFVLLKKEPMVLRELVRLGPASGRMASFSSF